MTVSSSPFICNEYSKTIPICCSVCNNLENRGGATKALQNPSLSFHYNLRGDSISSRGPLCRLHPSSFPKPNPTLWSSERNPYLSMKCARVAAPRSRPLQSRSSRSLNLFAPVEDSRKTPVLTHLSWRPLF